MPTCKSSHAPPTGSEHGGIAPAHAWLHVHVGASIQYTDIASLNSMHASMEKTCMHGTYTCTRTRVLYTCTRVGIVAKYLVLADRHYTYYMYQSVLQCILYIIYSSTSMLHVYTRTSTCTRPCHGRVRVTCPLLLQYHPWNRVFLCTSRQHALSVDGTWHLALTLYLLLPVLLTFIPVPVLLRGRKIWHCAVSGMACDCGHINVLQYIF